MKYYKIKVTSPIEREKKDYSITDKDKEILSKIGIDYSPTPYKDKEFDEFIYEWDKTHNIYLSYNDKKGFSLVREFRGNMFSEEALNGDEPLKQYLSDKEYELIETDGEPRFMRYRMKE